MVHHSLRYGLMPSPPPTLVPWGGDPSWGHSAPWGQVPLVPLSPSVPGGNYPQPAVSNALYNPGVSNPYGVDVICLFDLDPYFNLTGGVNTLVQDLYHRIITTTGTLFYDGNWGFNVRQLLSQAVTQGTVNTIQSIIQSQMLADERVAAALVSATYTIATQSLVATITITPQNGLQAFQFVVGISQVTTALLNVTPVLA